MNDKYQELLKYSNPQRVKALAKRFLGDVEVYISTQKNKKYMVQDPNGGWVHFGQMGYEDYTKHKDEERRKRYLARATNIRGNWRETKYSPNNLSINLLWQ